MLSSRRMKSVMKGRITPDILLGSGDRRILYLKNKAKPYLYYEILFAVSVLNIEICLD